MIRDWRKIIRDTRRPVEMGRKKKIKKNAGDLLFGEKINW